MSFRAPFQRRWPGRAWDFIGQYCRRARAVEDMYEPLLDSKRLLSCGTRTGRVATRKAYEHLGYPYNGD